MKDFDELFKKSGETDRQLPFEEVSWENLESRLDKKRRRRVGIWWWGPLLVLGGAYFGWSRFYVTNHEERIQAERSTNAGKPLSEKADPNVANIEELIRKEEKEVIETGKSIENSTKNDIPKSFAQGANSAPVSITIDTPVNKKENSEQGSAAQKPNRPVLSFQQQVELEKENSPKGELPENKNEINKTRIESQSEHSTVNKVAKTLVNQEDLESDNSNTTENVEKQQNSNSTDEPSAPDEKVVNNDPTKDTSAPLSNGVLIDNQNLFEQSGKTNVSQNRPTVLEFKEPKEKKIQWEVEFMFSANSFKYRPLLTQFDTVFNPSFQSSVRLIQDNDSGFVDSIFISDFLTDEEARSIQPLFKLSIGAKVTRYLKIRGGFIFIDQRRNEPNNFDELIDGVDFQYVYMSTYKFRVLMVDLGFTLQTNYKRWNPYVGASVLYGINWKSEFKETLLDSNLEEVALVDTYSNSVNVRAFDYSGIQMEGGVKYSFNSKVDVGLNIFTIGFLSRPSIYLNSLKKTQVGLLLNYRF